MAFGSRAMNWMSSSKTLRYSRSTSSSLAGTSCAALSVVMREGVERFAQHLARLGRHQWDIDQRLELRFVGEVLRDLGDVAGVIADALEIDDDVEHGCDGAQIRRHRLLQGEQVQAVGLDEHVEVVDVIIGPQDVVRQLRHPSAIARRPLW